MKYYLNLAKAVASIVFWLGFFYPPCFVASAVLFYVDAVGSKFIERRLR